MRARVELQSIDPPPLSFLKTTRGLQSATRSRSSNLLTTPPPTRRCEEHSNSTGSSKRWRLRELLCRSINEGKETFVFLAPRCEFDKPKAAAVEKVEKAVPTTEQKKKKRSRGRA
ncbi:hypothetical protein Droror1_Dr00002247 [Drosera rotundifolia]